MQKIAPSLDTLKGIIKDVPTPFHLYDERRIRENARALNRAFSWNQGFREYYAVKANPNPFVLDILRQEGCGMDCASETELMLAEACGFSGDGIMFSSNMTPVSEFAYARKLGAIINLDDINAIDTVLKTGPLPELVCLRLNPGGEFAIGKTVMGTPLTSKFGMTEAQVFEAIERMAALGVKRFALHSFLGSNVLSEDYYPKIARLLFALALRIHEKLGAKIEMINLSGGVGVPYRPEETAPSIEVIGQKVKLAYDELIVGSALHPLRMAAELGRYMTGAAGYLVATAIHQKRTYRNYVGLDSSAVDLMRPAMYGAYHHITIAGKESAPASTVYDVVGALCENNDKFATERLLPEIENGDIVVIHDTGAHGHCMGYNYNGKLRSAEVLLKEDGSHRLIRRRQTPADYFATLDYPGLPDQSK